MSAIYLICWIFIGNFIFLNLFLAILLDGFGSSDAINMKEETDDEIMELNKLHNKIVEEKRRKDKFKKTIIKDNDKILQGLYVADDSAKKRNNLRRRSTITNSAIQLNDKNSSNTNVGGPYENTNTNQFSLENQTVNATSDRENTYLNHDEVYNPDGTVREKYYHLNDIDVSFEEDEIEAFVV